MQNEQVKFVRYGTRRTWAGWLKRLVRRFVCWTRGHKPNAPYMTVAEDCDLEEPNGRREKVNLRLLITVSGRSAQRLNLVPCGLVARAPNVQDEIQTQRKDR